jgi:hypothetical protein
MNQHGNKVNKTMLVLIITLLKIGSISTQKTFFTGGGCSQIKGIGSPILMIANAHQYVNDALNPDNKHTDVALLYFATPVEGSVKGSLVYKMVLGVTSFKGLEYFGIMFQAQGDNQGSMTTIRKLMTKEIAMVGVILAIADPETELAEEIKCGDLKLLFKFYGQSPNPDLPYAFTGRNGNGAGLSLLSRLDNESSNQKPRKICIEDNITFFDLFDNHSDSDGDDTYICLPDSNSVSYIRGACDDVGSNQGLRRLYIGLNDGSGNYVDTWIEETNSDEDDITLDLSLGDTLHFVGDVYDYTLIDLIKDGVSVAKIECGTIADTTHEFTTRVEDFLGFDNPHTSNDVIYNLGVVYYVRP